MLKNALQNHLYLGNPALAGIVGVNSMFSLVLLGTYECRRPILVLLQVYDGTVKVKQ